MKLRATELGWKTAVAIAVAGALTISSCASAQQPAKDAECEGIRAFYQRADDELIDRGACDNSADVTACVPHVALREALIKTLEERQCRSLPK